MFDFANPVNILAIGLGLALLLHMLKRRASTCPLPPSVQSYPLIGHLFSAPTSNDHLGFIEIGNRLKTSIFTLKSFGQTTIVLNSIEDATNLLKNRSAIYSDRYCAPMLGDPLLMDSGNFIDFLGYNDRLRKCRRLMHPWLNKKACESFHESQVQDARLLLQKLMLCGRTSSEVLYKEVFRALSGTLLHSIYGYRISGEDDPLIKEAIQEQKNKTLNDLLSKTKEGIASGDYERSIIESSVYEAKALGLSSEETDNYLSYIGISLYLESQRKAQAEIDEILGDTRLPGMEDMQRLPYTNRLIQETLRWRPILPLGIPHAVSKDDFYQGFLIPKGATVVGNIWAMSRDKRFYKDAEESDPDRFLDSSIPPCPIFGFGRRECPGVHFAESSLFSIIASVLAAFNIKAPDSRRLTAPGLGDYP
ncbi:cytochrome P450 [Rhizoctonia solani]|uniref:Cytochrome P450 n=1 Tax=Rhizoctonia solani TaxID=456999 RepID=A0A8H7HEI3_9AGAM|nr:cytochrome P450 [Rhizoctonia solani]